MITRLILRSGLLGCLVLAGMALPASAVRTLEANAPRPLPVTAPATAEGQLPDPQVWTTWGANQYALADDGGSIWIGVTGGVMRWDIGQRNYRRYTRVDGLPHSVVLAIAVDAAGNRWFGGDGGLSRLDPGERWTHFTTANSGLYANTVDAIAVGGGDALYLSHGLPDGSVTRRAADGAWHWFPNREAAVQADYALIRQTRGHTRLWAVVGDEVWIGYRAYDGAEWHDRAPAGVSGQPLDVWTDSRHHLWALVPANAGYQGSTVYEWDGSGWSEHDVTVTFSGKVTALAVAPDDAVWVGLQQREGMPYATETARITRLNDDDSWSLAAPGPVAALLPMPEGLWAIGPSWLMQPDRTVIDIADEPQFKDLPDILVEPGGRLWLYSGFQEPYTVGAVQTFDDNGTAALHDDRWQVFAAGSEPVPGSCELVTAWERSANGDIWYAGYCYWRFPFSMSIVRYHGQERVDYPNETLTYYDIFAQDDRHTWFVGQDPWSPAQAHVKGLDDGGTPTDTGDDVWQDLTVPASGQHPVVAVDAGGRLWYGDSLGLYRYDGSSWLPIYTDRGVCDLAPAADGTLYVQLADYQPSVCQPSTGEAVTVLPDGTVSWPQLIETLVEQEPESVRSASRRNTLWAIAPDGAIWTIAGSDRGSALHRRDKAGLRTFALPVNPKAVQRLEVDAHNRVWLAANSQLWRMSGQLDFALEAQPAAWLLAPGRARQGQLRVLSIEGYSGAVRLSALETPPGITVKLGADSIAAGQSVTLTLEAAPGSPPAVQRLVLSATDGVLTHMAVLTVTVVSELHDTFLPAVYR